MYVIFYPSSTHSSVEWQTGSVIFLGMIWSCSVPVCNAMLQSGCVLEPRVSGGIGIHHRHTHIYLEMCLKMLQAHNRVETPYTEGGSHTDCHLTMQFWRQKIKRRGTACVT
ncbi:hypothetical protein PHYPO_G00217180 [Pangasianodon hypophthalmus]|uniref:Uncharacterized protein n=1 Tax=Pangasianodon hypophthalmus TaxID=310915 RepID=A0A5N5P836_PANHP|nr:hypothetical protein PHYPO_G00217180 [Pangasianodon hypophthalmus]